MASFFKYEPDNNVLIRAGLFVYSPNETLLIEDKDTYTYPTIDGWRLFDTAPQARAFFNVPDDVIYQE